MVNASYSLTLGIAPNKQKDCWNIPATPRAPFRLAPHRSEWQQSSAMPVPFPQRRHDALRHAA
jgi:hypothetical protein